MMIMRVKKMLGIAALLLISGQAAYADSFWSSGKYGGGTPSNRNPKDTAVAFNILNNKKTVKEFAASFPVTCTYTDATEVTRVVSFFGSISPTFNLRKVASQLHNFTYTDEFDVNWDTQVSFKWNSSTKTFKVRISTLAQLEDNTCKADITLAPKVVKLHNLR